MDDPEYPRRKIRKDAWFPNIPGIADIIGETALDQWSDYRNITVKKLITVLQKLEKKLGENGSKTIDLAIGPEFYVYFTELEDDATYELRVRAEKQAKEDKRKMRMAKIESDLQSAEQQKIKLMEELAKLQTESTMGNATTDSPV